MVEPLAFLNGLEMPLSAAGLSLVDPGFIHGAVVTDNCRTWNGQLFRWADHQERFRRDCDDCFIPMPYCDDEIIAIAERLIERNGPEDLHLVTFATPGDGLNPTFGMFTRPIFVERNRHFDTYGARLEIVGHQPVSGDAILPPRIKHRNRFHWHLAEYRLKNPGAIAVLTDSPGGSITETGIAAVLAVKDATLLIPPRDLILDSITLRVTLEFAEQEGWAVKATPLPRRDLLGADEVMLAGTGFGIAGVSAIDGQTIPWPGPFTKRLQSLWNGEVNSSRVQPGVGRYRSGLRLHPSTDTSYPHGDGRG